MSRNVSEIKGGKSWADRLREFATVVTIGGVALFGVGCSNPAEAKPAPVATSAEVPPQDGQGDAEVQNKDDKPTATETTDSTENNVDEIDEDARIAMVLEALEKTDELVSDIYIDMSDEDFAKLSDEEQRAPLDAFFKYAALQNFSADVSPVYSAIAKYNPLEGKETDGPDEIMGQLKIVIATIGDLLYYNRENGDLTREQKLKILVRATEAYYGGETDKWTLKKGPGMNHTWPVPDRKSKDSSKGYKQHFVSMFMDEKGQPNAIDHEAIDDMKVVVFEELPEIDGRRAIRVTSSFHTGSVQASPTGVFVFHEPSQSWRPR